ncbi:Malolactic regulator [Lacticaseibacillus rhamnosus]|uniref:Malolactic regulator n=1 Tax=Lacticaseibacillus rhamnosus TaxID=47715 RepID=A0AAP8J2K1_LACRH|nr:Malolactic regulator [Lacticaseibacillus rhamnosus]PTM23791.1 Malolactic regulator [Lacticaseibacillus rhamnosus]TXK06889.1 Malolactic regulator [Lacticaseibacillus rhamnosus]
MTRSQSQKSACKDLSRNDQTRVITTEAAYTPTSKRSCSRLTKKGPAESKN